MTEIAYLNSEYPSLSHTFIEREVRGVRAHGVGVKTFSIRRPGPSGRLGRAHEEAAVETEYVLDGVAKLLASGVVAFVRNPAGFLRAHVAAQRLAPGGLKARALHMAYALEGARLARMLRRRGLRHVHVHMANNGAAVALLACTYDRRLSYSLSIHGPAEFWDVVRLRVGVKAERATFVRCISNFCRSQVMAWTDPSAWERFHVVPTGVDPNRFVPAAARPQDRLRILNVARLAPVKGHSLLLEVCARLSAAGVAWSLDLVGDGPLRASLERKAVDLGIGDRVTFSGPVSQDEIVAHFDASNVLVMSSFNEGVPVVAMEAMASGMAVVATRVGGMTELVEHESTGLLVDAGSADSLVSALTRLAGAPEVRAAMGAAGRAAVARRYDVNDAGAAMARLFERHAGAAE